jgi:Protein of unknown function (DUF3168)
MSDPFLALQAAIRSRLVAASTVTALVPATSILDANQRPSVMPALILGEGYAIPDEGLRRDRHQVYLDLHIWAQEPGTALVKQVVGAIRDALTDAFWSIPGVELADLCIEMARFMRDPDGVHSHAALTLKCRAREIA